MKKIISFFVFFFVVEICFSQITDQIINYRNDEYGSINERREAILEGNLIRTLFYNNGEVGQWAFSPSGEWPRGSGREYLDGLTFLTAAEVIAPGNGAIIHPLEIGYREWMDRDPKTGLIWGFEPIPGYANTNSTSFAVSTDPSSWPQSWPEALPKVNESWNGQWYGYFGKNIFNADQESFYVMDDSKDKEWTRSPYNFYPIASDTNRGGLGLRVEVRSFVWSEPVIEDVAFFHYDIVNLSDYDYEKTVSGYYLDCSVGGSGDSGDDMVGIDTYNDITYEFDGDGINAWENWETGYMGFAFLETASNSNNFIDDDEDGLIDESREDGIDNDNDWQSYSDLNENNLFDNGEPLNDDVGEDGIGPDNENYTGADNGEGDGLPTHGEPNFDETDIHEADMIGVNQYIYL